MKKLGKCKIVPQAKFVKFKVKDFVEIPTIHHDKAVPPLLDCLKSSSPLNVSPPWLLKFSSCPPAWLMTQKSFPPPHPRGEDTMRYRCILFEYQARIFRFSFSNVSHISLNFVTWHLTEHLHTQDFQRAMAHLNFWTNTLLSNFSENSAHSI